MSDVSLLENGLICVLGLGLHFTLKWANLRAEDPDDYPSFGSYFRAHPAKNTAAVLATLLVFAIAYYQDWLNPYSAMAAGYIGNDIVNKLATQFGGPPK